MESWRRQKGEIQKQEMQGTRSHNRKPPLGIWQPTVPSWEKKFCTTVGAVPWRKLLETKKFMYLYDNVVQWNDSAGEEAFHNAKNRFWALINGFPCDISLPDPDIYIDEIDWNAKIEPGLLLDLERHSMAPDDGDKDENVVLFGNTLLTDQSFGCAGWGDAEEDLKKDTNLSLDPGFWNCDRNVENNKSPLELNPVQTNGDAKDEGYGGAGWNSSCGQHEWENNNGWENNNNGWENNHKELENMDYRRTDELPGTWHGHNLNRERAGWHMSRYKTSRFHGDDNQRDRGWRYGRGRKRISAYEQPFNNNNPMSKQWHLNTCGPVSHYGSGKTENPWSPVW